MIPRALFSGAAVILATVLVHLPATAEACTACMGDPNSKIAGAINAAMFLMLGFVALMLGALGAFAWYLARRAPTAGPIVSDASTGSSDELS